MALGRLRMYIFILILLSVGVFALDDCKHIARPQDIPCRVISTWNYTPPCSDYNATVINSDGMIVSTYNFSSFPNSTLCNFTFNLSSQDSYVYIVNNGDTGSILVEVGEVILELSGGFFTYFMLVLWLVLVIMTLKLKGRRGKTIQVFNLMQVFIGIVAGIRFLPINILVGVLVSFASVGIFVGKTMYDD